MPLTFPPDTFTRLLQTALARATHLHSPLHGQPHWRAVTHTALDLAPHVPGADPLVGFLFGLLHDNQRLTDGHDLEHGPRAALLTQSLHDENLLPPLTPEQLDRLTHAIRYHTTARHSNDPTVGLCWDADRLNLWRIGVEPRPEFLSTPAARDPNRIAAHATLPGQHTPWPDLHHRLLSSCAPR